MASRLPAPLPWALVFAAAALAPGAAHCLDSADRDDPLSIVSPWRNTLVEEGPVVLAGRRPAGAEEVFVILNGRSLGGAVRMGRRFFLSFTPPQGFNEIEVRAGDTTEKLTFAFQTGSGGQPKYAYHRPFQEGKCDPCHRRSSSGDSLTDAAVCYGCHEVRTVLFPYVHGPVAAGSCLICHDPHGSSVPGLCRVPPEEMCLPCHDQLSTAEHTSSRTKVCTMCHHPHYSMNRRFLRGPF